MKVSSNVRRRFSDNPQGEEIGDDAPALRHVPRRACAHCGAVKTKVLFRKQDKGAA
jgi:hypothetical protein